MTETYCDDDETITGHPCGDWHESTCPGRTCTFEDFRFLNVYELFREYGGREEGGWWYDRGEPVYSEIVSLGAGEPDFRGWTQAVHDALDRVEREWPRTRTYCNVNYNGGDYVVYVDEHPARAFPEHTPHYE